MITLTKAALAASGACAGVAAAELSGAAYLLATTEGDVERAAQGFRLAKASSLPLAVLALTLPVAGLSAVVERCRRAG